MFAITIICDCKGDSTFYVFYPPLQSDNLALKMPKKENNKRYDITI